MKKLSKKVSVLLSCLVLSTAMPVIPGTSPIIAEAHPGRTDSQGGHHDYKN